LRETAKPAVPMRVQCPECGKTFPNNEVEAHLQKCEEGLIPCSHCFAQFTRGQLGDHVKLECPLASVTCKFGCEDQLVRRELEDHMEQNVQKHLSMLQATVERQQQMIDNLSKLANRSFPEYVAGLTFKQAVMTIFLLFLLMWLKIRVTPVIIVGAFVFGLIMKLKHGKQQASNCHSTAGVPTPGVQTANSACAPPQSTSGNGSGCGGANASCCKGERKGCKILLCIGLVFLLYLIF